MFMKARMMLRIVDDLLCLLVIAPYAFHEGGLEVVKLNLIEGHGIVRRAVRLHERVLPFRTIAHV